MDKVPSIARSALMPFLAMITLVGFGGGGVFLIERVQDRALADVLVVSMAPGAQLLWGALVGVGMGVLAWLLVRSRWMREVRLRYAGPIGPWVQEWHVRWAVSICAGVGEELFFRGALQHWLGIPVTALVFVAIHGYLDPRNIRIATYGLLLTGGMLLFGFLARDHGLYLTMVAHTLFDVILLDRLAVTYRREFLGPQAPDP